MVHDRRHVLVGLGDLLGKGKDLAHDAKKEVLHVIEDGQRKPEKQRAKLEKPIA